MNIELIVQDNNSGKVVDLSELVSSITWSTTLLGQPGELTISCIYDDSAALGSGSPVSFKYNEEKVFFGYVFYFLTYRQRIAKNNSLRPNEIPKE